MYFVIISLLCGTGSFLGLKRTGRSVNHPQPYSAEVKERVVNVIKVECERNGIPFSTNFTVP